MHNNLISTWFHLQGVRTNFVCCDSIARVRLVLQILTNNFRATLSRCLQNNLGAYCLCDLFLQKNLVWEGMGFEYDAQKKRIAKGGYFTHFFLAVNPTNKIPTINDPNNLDDFSMTMWEHPGENLESWKLCLTSYCALSRVDSCAYFHRFAR